jgi:ribosomal protein S18 acetylase RimI-like enzyme
MRMESAIVYEGHLKNGDSYVLRYPQPGDEQMMTDYINALSAEKTYVRFQGEVLTVEEELAYLTGQLERIAHHQTVNLFIVTGQKIIGVSNIDMKDRTERHEANFGISIAKDFRGEGLGKILMEYMLKEAEKQLPNLKIITLSVYGNNDLAQNMYKKFGFVEYGTLPEGIIHRDQYVDHIFMYKKVR